MEQSYDGLTPAPRPFVRPTPTSINTRPFIHPTLASSRHSSSAHRTTTFSFASPTPRPPPPLIPPSRPRPFCPLHRPPTLIRSAATTFISVFAKSPVIVSPSRASRTNGHGTKVRGSPPGLSSCPSDSAKRKSDERTRSGSESDKMPPPSRVFGIICPKEAIHRKSIQRWPFHHNEVAVKSP